MRWSTLNTFIAASISNVRSAERRSRFREAALHWAFMAEAVLPTKHLRDFWPDIAQVQGNVMLAGWHPWHLPCGERAILNILVRYLRPRRLFEFGTFTGETTVLLADSAPPEATVHTLDLPEQEFRALGACSESQAVCPDLVGRAFRGEPRYAHRIVPHRCSSREFDFTPFKGAMDFVFIDASHAFKDVMHDSHRALEMLSSRGVIVWDDYLPSIPGVVRALRGLGRHLELTRVADSRFVLYRRTEVRD